jgi:hypothetical protein
MLGKRSNAMVEPLWAWYLGIGVVLSSLMTALVVIPHVVRGIDDASTALRVTGVWFLAIVFWPLVGLCVLGSFLWWEYSKYVWAPRQKRTRRGAMDPGTLTNDLPDMLEALRKLRGGKHDS